VVESSLNNDLEGYMAFFISKYTSSLTEPQTKKMAMAASMALVFLVGFTDYKTGYEISFFIFYALPISISAWFVSRNFGVFISLLAISVWFYADIKSGHRYSEDWILHWNGGVRLAFFMINAYVLSALKKQLDFEKNWARVDGLTSALNGRGFRDRLEDMFPFYVRTKSPFALAFIDLNHFKKVNDKFCHLVGDETLIKVTQIVQEGIRSTDALFRYGC